MTFSKFEDIPVWQQARKFIAKVYSVTYSKFNNDFELTNQFRRAAISIALNIAEGFERKTNKDFARFISISKGSAGECRSILYIALDLKHISESDFNILSDEIISISKQLSKFNTYLLDTKRN